jgi:hypothetical protein
MQDSAQLWKEREVIFSQFAGLAQVGQNVCLSRRRSLRPKPFWLSKSDRLDCLRYADLSLLIGPTWITVEWPAWSRDHRSTLLICVSRSEACLQA